MPFEPLNGPAAYKAISVTSTAQEVKVGAAILVERHVVTLQPTDGVVYFGYDSSVTATTGTKVFKNQVFPIEAGEQLPVYVVADTGETVDVRITEVS